MAQVLTVPVENEALVETQTTSQLPMIPWWDPNLLRSPNGNHPDVLSTDRGLEIDEDDSWESEGWRYIETTEEGQITRVRLPLTRYDLLHPQEDYVIVHKTAHGRNTTYIGTTVGTHLSHDPKALVLDDVGVDLNLPGVVPVSPDISVILDVAQEKDWSIFKCHEEGVYPSVIFEITSPGTRGNDFGEKRDYYRWAGVAYYVILDIIYDKNKQVSGYDLFAFELSGSQYIEMQTDHQNRYWLPPLGISVGIGDKGILCYDALGNLLMSHEEVTHAFNESEKERNAALERADEQTRIAQQETARATEQEHIAQQEAARATEQERVAEQEAARAAEQERIAQQERELAQREVARATEQEHIAQQEAARAAEQERIAQQERELAQQETARAAEQERIAQQEAARAAEQERIAQQEAARAAEQERIAQQEAARAAEQERIASEALQAQLAAEAQIAELLARMAELEGKS